MKHKGRKIFLRSFCDSLWILAANSRGWLRHKRSKAWTSVAITTELHVLTPQAIIQDCLGHSAQANPLLLDDAIRHRSQISWTIPAE
jgi:hypothetical protein